jgi:hypothetical protein
MHNAGSNALKRMAVFLVLSISTLSLPISGSAEVAGKRPYIEVAKGTRLCADAALDQSRAARDAGKVFWKVMSRPRANGTQAVAAFVFETIYDRQSGDTIMRESRYDEDYAAFFMRDPERLGRWLMISPEDGRVEATVGICPKKK